MSVVTCPYCQADGIDPRGLASHVRMCADDAHGEKYEVPDDFEGVVKENISDADAKKIDFRNVQEDVVDADEATKPTYCDECGSTELHELSEGEPIMLNGEKIGEGDQGDIICVDCGEIVVGEIK